MQYVCNMEKEDKHLSGAGLGEVWAKIKSHVTSALQGWDGRNTTASGVHTSNITHVGTIAYGTWQGSVIGASYLPVASGETGATAAGIVSTTSQSFAGQKTFKSRVNLDATSYANASLYTQNIYPQSTNTYEIGDDQHQFSIIRVNNFLTNGGNGFRFGANNGDIRFYGTKVIESFGPTTLVWTLGHNGGMTLHKGNLSVSAGNITASGNIVASGNMLASGNVTAYGNVVADGGVAAGGIADLG